MKKAGYLAVLTAAVCLGAASNAAAQYYAFGKNKVQYENFEWRSLKSEHVEVFYYPQEEPIARLAVVFAEESYKDLAAKFQYEVPRMIPMIVYSSHQHFEQTNVSPFFVPEGVQGFTDFMKGRVVLPYTGSYAEFRHVLHHEMVHVFQFAILDEAYSKHRRASFVVPPLWFSEGQAEYWLTQWDAQGTMVLSDMVLEGKLPEISELWRYDGTFTVYKLGQSLCQYIGETYGQDALRRLYTEIYKEDTFEHLIGRVTGVPASRVSEDWILAMKRRYYPEVKDRSSLGTSVQPRAVAQGVNLKPVAAPDTLAFGGSRYFFISARSGFTNIYSATYRGSERNVKSVVRGQRGSQFESFHPFESRIDVSRRNELAFVSKWNGRDALFIMDPQKGEIRLRRHVDGLISLASPAWSHDGSRIAFSGISPSGRSDLYVMSRDTGDVKRLTNDDYADLDPTWSPDDKTIAFASDRTRYGKEGHHNLFLLDVQSLEIRYLTYGPWMDQSPDVVAGRLPDRVHVGSRRPLRDLHRGSDRRRRARVRPAQHDARSRVATGREGLLSPASTAEASGSTSCRSRRPRPPTPSTSTPSWRRARRSGIGTNRWSNRRRSPLRISRTTGSIWCREASPWRPPTTWWADSRARSATSWETASISSRCRTTRSNSPSS